ncbi:DUF4252 domain-containing protein [Empedobacter brevis]|uniref:DUF4252 domain-containing protein n=1 Tax=Empedobacter brevis TaxID=247 RepID=UPI0039AF7FA3
MKKYVYIFALFIVGFANAQTNKFVEVYNQLQDKKGVTTITINKAMFSMMNNLTTNDSDMKELDGLFKKMNSIKMIMIDKANKEAKNQVKSTFDKMNLEELISISKEGSKVRFLTENANAKVFKNVLMSINNDDQQIYMIMDGEITASEMNKMVKESNHK